MATIEITDAPIHRRSRRPRRRAHRRSRFFDDPVTRWLLPHVEQRRRDRAVVPLYVAPYLRHGDTYVTGDGNGAAVAAARRRAAERGGGRGVRRCAGGAVGNVARFEQLAETFERHHPDEPLYYCQSLATVPAYQGRGIGSAFLRAMLTRRSGRLPGVSRGHDTAEPGAVRAPRISDPG